LVVDYSGSVLFSWKGNKIGKSEVLISNRTAQMKGILSNFVFWPFENWCSN